MKELYLKPKYKVGKRIDYINPNCYMAFSNETMRNGIVELDIAGNVKNVVLPCQFEDVGVFIDGVALVSQKNKNGKLQYGFVRRDGKMLGITEDKKSGELTCSLPYVKKQEATASSKRKFGISQNGTHYIVLDMVEEFNKVYGPIEQKNK